MDLNDQNICKNFGGLLANETLKPLAKKGGDYEDFVQGSGLMSGGYCIQSGSASKKRIRR
jgi:hypothetical protein